MASKRKLFKAVDAATKVRCSAGSGVIREEVWEDESGRIVRYNLAFINHFLTVADHGRVLGYDNSHGYHHRHFKGVVEAFHFVGYEALLNRFLDEVEGLRRETK
jgi:hypothetical protein